MSSIFEYHKFLSEKYKKINPHVEKIEMLLDNDFISNVNDFFSYEWVQFLKNKMKNRWSEEFYHQFIKNSEKIINEMNLISRNLAKILKIFNEIHEYTRFTYEKQIPEESFIMHVSDELNEKLKNINPSLKASYQIKTITTPITTIYSPQILISGNITTEDEDYKINKIIEKYQKKHPYLKFYFLS